MSPEKCEGHFGNDVIPFENFRKQAYQEMPKNIFKLLSRPCKAFVPQSPLKTSLSHTEETSIKKIGETHELLYVHESYTVNQLGELFKKSFPNSPVGYTYILDRIVKKYGDMPIGKSGWVLLTKDVLPGSKNKSVQEQKDMISNLAEKTGLPYKQANLVNVIASMLFRYVTSGERLFSNEPWTYTFVAEQVLGYPCIVGGFSSSGPHVFSGSNYGDSTSGSAAVLPVGPAEVV